MYSVCRNAGEVKEKKRRSSKKRNNDQVYNLNGLIVIGLLHKGIDCNKEEIDFVKSHQVTGKFCELRNNTPLESLKGGMGDIFIKLAR